VICGTGGGYIICGVGRAEDDWWWHSDRIGNMAELGCGCLGKFAMGRAKGRMENTGCEVMTIALCDSLLWLMVVAQAAWSLAPFFFWTRGKWDNLLCDA
jgi:hypothetical protein